MPDTTPDFNAAALDSVWGRRALDLPSELEFNTSVTPKDVDFLANRSVYIQVINTQAVLAGMTEPVLINGEEEGDWTIHNYGEAMCVSRGKLLFEDMPTEPSSTEQQSKGRGTLVKQAFDTASEMVDLAIENGWAGIEIIAGVRLMEWAVWMAAQDRDLAVAGFEPSEEEQAKRARIKSLESSSAPQQAKKISKP
jgi:hypothetical protein